MAEPPRQPGPRFTGQAGDWRGQSETIGIVLLIAIIVVGSTAVVAFGSTAIHSTQQASQLQRTEHTMTLFDSRSAMVALGESEMQQVDLAGGGDGTYTVEPDAGWLRIVHENYTGGGNREVVYNESLGALVYENGDTEIAYQGGGVWRRDGDHSTMVSPPEFHYRGSTLTLPVIRVTNQDAGAGTLSATVRSDGAPRRIYPNESSGGGGVGAPYDASGTAYGNPVRNGTVTVTVHSEYYRAWAEFFRTRSDGAVTEYDSNQTTTMALIGGGEVGDFEMPADGNAISVQGMPEGHPISNFTITLIDDDSDSANFNNLQWSLSVEEGPRRWEIHLRADSGCNGADLSVYYSEDGGATYQGWYADCGVTWTEADYDGDGADERKLAINMTSNATTLTNSGLSNSDLLVYSTGSRIANPTWDDHGDTVGWEDPGKTWGASESTTFYNVTNHYLTQFGSTYEIGVTDKSSDTVNERQSSGTLDYGASGQIFITFLHVTENDVEVDV